MRVGRAILPACGTTMSRSSLLVGAQVDNAVQYHDDVDVHTADAEEATNEAADEQNPWLREAAQGGLE